MNLADAIRQATQDRGFGLPAETTRVNAHPVVEAMAVAATSETVTPNPEQVFNPEPIQEETPMNTNSDSQEVAHSNSASTVVKLELFLTPDQLASLFKAVAAGQHTMLTAREAAGYLRIPVHSLETMASEGQVPGFQIDGKWRFAKQSIDEWLLAQLPQKGAA